MALYRLRGGQGKTQYFINAPNRRVRRAERDTAHPLTTREREVMALAAQGYSNSQIAEQLFVSPLTARTHIQRAMMKLAARDRAQLVVIAYQTGLVQPTPPPAQRSV